MCCLCLHVKKSCKQPPKINAQSMKKTMKKSHCFGMTYCSNLGVSLEGLRALKWEPKSHMWRSRSKKSKKNLIFGVHFWVGNPSGLKKASPESIFGPLEVNFGGSRGRISWIFALNFCLLICTSHFAELILTDNVCLNDAHDSLIKFNNTMSCF